MSGAHLVVLDCNGAASLQDGGRPGFLRYGLSASGPMDRLALATANALVGNAPDVAGIEFGMGGGRFRAVGASVRLALAGATCGVDVDGTAVAMHRSFVLREGSELHVGRPREGVFGYLAAAGGIAVPEAMGSRSLHRRAALGGVEGRVVQAGDWLPVPGGAHTGEPDRMLEAVPLDRDRPIRVVLGPQDDRFTAAGLATLREQAFTVSNRADRMGYQLDGPAIEHGGAGFNIVSDATAAGSIQVPGGGRPIVLLADRQTTGGYPKIATVISADLRVVAQRRPGDPIRFEAVDLGTAVRLAREGARRIAELAATLRPAMDEIDRLLAANLAGNAIDAFDDGGA